jgi:hypothetical protein
MRLREGTSLSPATGKIKTEPMLSTFENCGVAYVSVTLSPATVAGRASDGRPKTFRLALLERALNSLATS